MQVDWVDRIIGGLVSRTPKFWVELGTLEGRFYFEELDKIEIDRPIFVSGLARAGTTILLEILNSHPLTASHQYRDYPGVFIPIWWNSFLRLAQAREKTPKERSHRDGILVSSSSPEAFEEPIWMAFFDSIHDPNAKNILPEETTNPSFERFFRNHIKKILYLRSARRYLSKGNYNVSRLSYINRVLPESRFLVLWRDPVYHIASLLKQHSLFEKAEKKNKAVLRHMQRVGHFEFGLDFRPINFDDRNSVEQVVHLWAQGRRCEAYATTWAQTYTFVSEQVESDDNLRQQTAIINYASLCERPHETLSVILDAIRLKADISWISGQAERLHYPDYYMPELTVNELSSIREITSEALDRIKALTTSG